MTGNHLPFGVQPLSGKKLAFHTLGCKVNQYDTQAMCELMREAGCELAAFDGEADIYLINTCTVTGTGDTKSVSLIRRTHREHPQSDIIVCGCLAQRKAAELSREEGVRLVIGTQNRAQIVPLYAQAIKDNMTLTAVTPLEEDTPYEPLSIHRQEERTRATLKIQEGCRNRCTYCIIPDVRGPIRSRPIREIVCEATRLAAEGYSEVVLTGIHLSSYGMDWKDEHLTLLDAIRAVNEVEGVRRIRLGSLEPRIATKEFSTALAALPKVCPQFHLALQSGSDTVLARMARQYNTRMYREAANNLREAFQMCALTTDVLCGFPGETEEEAQQTEDFIREIGFARIHVFPYSRREGTKADRMPGQLPRKLKSERANRLIAIGHETAAAYMTAWQGKTVRVLLEDVEGGLFAGYTPEYIRVLVEGSEKCASGEEVRVLLKTVADDTHMRGIIIEEK